MESEENKITLPAIEGIDWECAISHFTGRELLLETMQEIYQSMPLEAERLEHCLEELCESEETGEEQFKAYRIQIHSMKGMANLMGALELGAFAKKLEDAAKEQDLRFICLAALDFAKEWSSCRDRLGVLFENTDGGCAPDMGRVREQLEELKAAFEVLNIEKMDECVHFLNQFAFSDDIKNDMERLRAFVLDLDEAEGIPLIKALMQKIN